MTDEVLNAIPHRQPFLFVDRIVEVDDTKIITEKKIEASEAFFKGHYPGNPLMPGVLICESVFQSAAILISRKMETSSEEKIPVITRIKEAKFKNMVLPDDLMQIQAEIVERLADTFFLKGVVRVNGKVALRVEFAVMLAPKK